MRVDRVIVCFLAAVTLAGCASRPINERITQVALLPTAWYLGDSFRRSLRRPLAEVLHWDGW